MLKLIQTFRPSEQVTIFWTMATINKSVLSHQMIDKHFLQNV